MHSHPWCCHRSADIKVKEPSLEAMARGKIVYEAPNFMTVNTALEQLLEVEQQRQEQGKALLWVLLCSQCQQQQRQNGIRVVG